MKIISPLHIALSLRLAAITGFALQPSINASRVFTADDYARAKKMLGFNTSALIDRSGVRPTWLPDGRFCYRVMTPTGSE